jgi:hypothetical protein
MFEQHEHCQPNNCNLDLHSALCDCSRKQEGVGSSCDDYWYDYYYFIRYSACLAG